MKWSGKIDQSLVGRLDTWANRWRSLGVEPHTAPSLRPLGDDEKLDYYGFDWLRPFGPGRTRDIMLEAGWPAEMTKGEGA